MNMTNQKWIDTIRLLRQEVIFDHVSEPDLDCYFYVRVITYNTWINFQPQRMQMLHKNRKQAATCKGSLIQIQLVGQEKQFNMIHTRNNQHH